MSTTKIEYRLNALDSFVCIGADCPASCCCAKWDIDLDEEIYKRWEDLPDPVERNRLLDGVITTVKNGDKLRRLAMSENGCCRLLADDGLCSVQVRYGADFMPSVCHTYPRSASESQMHALATASLSCPEIARLVLFAPGNQPVFRKSGPAPVPHPVSEDTIRYALTELLDRVMVEPRFSVAARVYYLADFITRMSRLSIQGQLNATTLGRAAAAYKQDLYQIGVGIKERRLRPDPAVAGSFWLTLARIGHRLDLLPELERSAALAVKPAPAPEERTAQYTAAHAEIMRLRNAAHPRLVSHEPRFARYLHATLMYHGFPWNPAVDNYIASLMRALVPFALARLRLWLIAAHRGTLTDNDVLEAAYIVERRISHSKRVLAILDANPELLELDRYHTTFVDL